MVLKSGDKVKINKDYAMLEKHGIQSLLETPEVFQKTYTVKCNSFDYINLQEEGVNNRDFHLDCLIKQK